ncbi:acyltransferase family protein [Bacillus luti]|uniref:acyltransferase family protein n=1 Tax=Bacillus luti TaxID=2026191 RepID=UPI003D0042BD
MKQREFWIDIAKGLSIILVVMGHSGQDTVVDDYLAWFRMPLFFALSGLLFKPIDPSRFIIWAKKRTKQLMIPYISYGLLIALLIFVSTFNLNGFIKDILKLGYGGLALKGPYGVFWFITCLLLSQLFFGYISRFAKHIQILIVALSYILAHIISLSKFATVMLPWHLDVALMTVVYYALGYYGKEIIRTLIKKYYTPIVCSAIWIPILLLDLKGKIEHTLDLKYKVYSDPILDLVIPITMVLTVCSFCYWFSKVPYSKYLIFLGTNTITIMYLHIPINLAIKQIFNVDYSLFIFTLIGVFTPLLISFILKKSDLLSKIYLGKQPKTAKAA